MRTANEAVRIAVQRIGAARTRPAEITVADGDEWPPDRDTPHLYWPRPLAADAAAGSRGYWLVYCPHPDVGLLRSSLLVIVDKDSGTVVYEGSANDEG